MRKILPGLTLIVATLALAACGLDASGRGADPSIEEIRAATEKYRDVEVALADGYVRDPLDICETPAQLGAPADAGVMGVHYLHPDLLQIGPDGTRLDVSGTHTDFLRPAVLVYEPQADGSLELVAVENLVLEEAWEAEGNRRPPTFAGEEYAYMPDDPGKVIRGHYDRHLWIFRENPNGIDAQYNPAATCDHYVRVMPMMGH